MKKRKATKKIMPKKTVNSKKTTVKKRAPKKIAAKKIAAKKTAVKKTTAKLPKLKPNWKFEKSTGADSFKLPSFKPHKKANITPVNNSRMTDGGVKLRHGRLYSVNVHYKFD